jgi:SPP1 family predicted phage head-tail adaptor
MPSMKPSIGQRDNISLDDVCNLLSLEKTGEDNLGQPIMKEKPFMVFCSKLSIVRAEFSTAGQLGHKPDMMLVVDSDSYDKEQHLDYYGKKYSVYKSFQRADGFTELYCEVNAGD